MSEERPQPDFWDEHGRGPLQREFHRRCGFEPGQNGPGFASFARAVHRVMHDDKAREFPEQFRAMLAAVVAEFVGPILEAEREAIRAEMAAEVKKAVGEALEPFRRAWKQTNGRVLATR